MLAGVYVFCVSIDIYVHTHVHMYVCMHACMHACRSVGMYVTPATLCRCAALHVVAPVADFGQDQSPPSIRGRDITLTLRLLSGREVAGLHFPLTLLNVTTLGLKVKLV